MEVKHKKSNEIHIISLDDWNRLGELGLQSGYKVISNDELQSNKIDLKAMKPLIQKIELNEPLETAIYNENFDSKKYKVKQIKDFLKSNPDKIEYFAKDKRKIQ